jgi:hypothetical protein
MGAVMQIAQIAEEAEYLLDHLGPFAEPHELERALDALPPCSPDARMLAGFLDARTRGPGPHWLTLMSDSDYSAGFWYGVETMLHGHGGNNNVAIRQN